jgi:gluconate 2-dehydrogenase gamma chain
MRSSTVRYAADPESDEVSVRTRRNFLEAAAAAAVAGGAAGCGAKSNWRSFADGQGRTLEALLDHIIPADDMPGARAAGVIHYIDRQLRAHFREHRQTYVAGLAAADRLAGGNFAGAPAERQAEVVQQLERDQATRPFFDLLVSHAMQGFYGNPRHGGNGGFASWRMLGIPPVPVRGRDQYEFPKGGSDAKS